MKTIIVIISKNKSKDSQEQNVLGIQFYIGSYAVQISSGLVNKYVTSCEAVTSL